MISEADWKHFKQVKADALDKCCQQVLDDVRKGIDDPELSNHAKYLYLYKLMEKSDKQKGLQAESGKRLIFKSEL